MICSNCGKETSDIQEKCPYCGNDLGGTQAAAAVGNTVKRFCAECGALLRDNVMFCTKCGAKSKLNPGKPVIPNTVSQGAQPQLQAQPSRKPDEVKGGAQRKGIAAAVVCVIVIGIVAVAFIGIHSTRQASGVQEAKDNTADVQEMQPQQESMVLDEKAQETQSVSARTEAVENVPEKVLNEEQETPEIIQLDSRYIRSIQVSSELTDSTKTYRAESVLDGNRETCWCEGADGTGAGETLVIEFTQPVYLTEVAFLNGYMKNETVYDNNGKIRCAVLETEEGRFEVSFADWQYQEIADDLYSDSFTFDEPVETQYLSVMILEAQKGAKYEDTCLTELALWGYAGGADLSVVTLEEGTYSWSNGSNEDEAVVNIFGLYDSLCSQAADSYGSDCEYALYDMDHDGIEELVVSWGTSDADWTNTVYTVDASGNLVEVGEFYGQVSLYEAENGDGIYSVYGHMGYQEVEWITKEGSMLHAETILSEETEEYYENDYPIPMAGIDESIADNE